MIQISRFVFKSVQTMTLTSVVIVESGWQRWISVGEGEPGCLGGEGRGLGDRIKSSWGGWVWNKVVLGCER